MGGTYTGMATLGKQKKKNMTLSHLSEKIIQTGFPRPPIIYLGEFIE